MDKTNKTYQQENDEILQFILNERFFKPFKEPLTNESTHSLKNGSSLELYITSDCNLKCKYCYLQRHGDKLYPHEIRSSEKIIHNFKLLLDWCINENFSFNDIDLFSGEIWGLYLGNKILDILLEYIDKGLKIGCVVLPTNCSFIAHDDTLNIMQNYIDKFEKRNSRLMISASIDGKILEDDTRPSKDNKLVRDDEFYKRVFDFCEKNKFLFHPMVSPQSCAKWIENYEWYIEQIKGRDFGVDDPIMMLEVRNDEWTDEYIKDYLKFLDYLFDLHKKKYGSSPQALVDSLFLFENTEPKNGYSNLALPLNENHQGCTVSTSLCVRLGDLSIPPCHRTSYPQFIYGNFVVENDKITGVKSNNVAIATKILLQNTKASHHGCDVCPYGDICLRGCFGAQYEDAKEIFMPNKSVCKMFYAKYNFLIDLYTRHGIFDELKKVTPIHNNYRYVQKILKAVDKIQMSRGQ